MCMCVYLCFRVLCVFAHCYLVHVHTRTSAQVCACGAYVCMFVEDCMVAGAAGDLVVKRQESLRLPHVRPRADLFFRSSRQHLRLKTKTLLTTPVYPEKQKLLGRCRKGIRGGTLGKSQNMLFHLRCKYSHGTSSNWTQPSFKLMLTL